MADDKCFQCGATIYSPVDGSQPTECPECCILCGEAPDAEMGEFWDEQNGESVFAHAQCGLDRGFRLA